MKVLKVSLVLLFVSVAVIGTAFRAENTSAADQKKFAQVGYEWVNTSDFLFIGETPSSPISDVDNWDDIENSPTNGSEALSHVFATYTTTEPDKDDIIAALQTEYDRLLAINLFTLQTTFVNNYFFDVTLNGETVRITIKLQDIQ